MAMRVLASDSVHKITDDFITSNGPCHGRCILRERPQITASRWSQTKSPTLYGGPLFRWSYSSFCRCWLLLWFPLHNVCICQTIPQVSCIMCRTTYRHFCRCSKQDIYRQLYFSSKHQDAWCGLSRSMYASAIGKHQQWKLRWRSQLSSCSATAVLSMLRRVLLNCSIIPLDCGWYGIVRVWVIPNRLQISLTKIGSKFFPWSVCG